MIWKKIQTGLPGEGIHEAELIDIRSPKGNRVIREPGVDFTEVKSSSPGGPSRLVEPTKDAGSDEKAVVPGTC